MARPPTPLTVLAWGVSGAALLAVIRSVAHTLHLGLTQPIASC